MGHARDTDSYGGYFPGAPPAIQGEAELAAEKGGFVAKPAEETAEE